jgi:hypothetical protein
MADSDTDHPFRVVEPYLTEHGPSPRSEIPVKSLLSAKDRGVDVFHPHKLTNTNKGTERVVYLPTHNPEEVIRVWVETNRDHLNDVSRSTITRRINQLYTPEWAEAWKTIAQEYELKSHQKSPDNPGKDPLRQCPKCGEAIRARKFVGHLEECS